MPSSCRPQSRPADGFECEQDTISRPKPALEHEEVLQSSTPTVVEFDIEHVAVTDDPRLWPRKRKVHLFKKRAPSHLMQFCVRNLQLITLGVVASAAIAPTLAVNMYNRESVYLDRTTSTYSVSIMESFAPSRLQANSKGPTCNILRYFSQSFSIYRCARKCPSLLVGYQ